MSSENDEVCSCIHIETEYVELYHMGTYFPQFWTKRTKFRLIDKRDIETLVSTRLMSSFSILSEFCRGLLVSFSGIHYLTLAHIFIILSLPTLLLSLSDCIFLSPSLRYNLYGDCEKVIQFLSGANG